MNLKATQIGNEGALVILKALETNSTLTSLSLLWKITIGNEESEAFTQALKNTGITSLNLSLHGIISKEEHEAFTQALKNIGIPSLNLTHRIIDKEEYEASLAASKNHKVGILTSLFDIAIIVSPALLVGMIYSYKMIFAQDLDDATQDLDDTTQGSSLDGIAQDASLDIG